MYVRVLYYSTTPKYDSNPSSSLSNTNQVSHSILLVDQTMDNTSTSEISEPLLSASPGETSTPSNSGARSTSDQHDNNWGMLSGRFYVAVAVAALPMLLFGFNTGVLNAPESVIFPTHSVWEWSVCVSAFCVGGLVGALSIGGLVHVYGRKPSLLLILVVNAFFGVFHVFTPNIYGLMVARLFVGVAGGAATVVTPLYLAELAPPETKGSIGTLTQLSCVMGILASVLWALPFLSETEWRWIFIPLPLVSGLGILIAVAGGLPESPKWLLLHHPLERGREARNILSSFRSAMDDDQIELQVLLTLQGSTMTTTTTTTVDTTIATTTTNATATITYDEDVEENEPITRVTNTSPSATSTSHRSFSGYLADPKSRIPVLS